jgi:hypothetical protein
MALLATKQSRKGEAALDRWTWVHLGTGLGLGLVLSRWWVAVVLLIAFEGLEAILRQVRTRKGGLFEYESAANIVADVVVALAGYLAVRWLAPGVAPL